MRLAPTVWRDKVYVGSDDGFVYCLRASDGGEQWKFRAAPNERKVLGSGKMISLWPVRTGVLVDDGTAYFGAGIFPAEGVAMYAVGAEDGQLTWCNDACGDAPQSRMSPQGYLLASKSRLFAPLGRVSPAAFDRQDGRLLYEAYVEHIIGGTYATLADNQLFTGTEQLVGFDQASPRTHSTWFWGQQLIVAPDAFYAATGRELFAVKRETYAAASLRRKGLLDRQRDLNTQIQKAKRGPEAALKQLQTQLETVNAAAQGKRDPDRGGRDVARSLRLHRNAGAGRQRAVCRRRPEGVGVRRRVGRSCCGRARSPARPAAWPSPTAGCLSVPTPARSIASARKARRRAASCSSRSTRRRSRRTS